MVVANDYCEAKGIGDPVLFQIKPMTHAKEEEIFDDEQRKSRLPCPRQTEIIEGESAMLPKGSLLERPKGNPKRNGPATGAWWRSNSRKGYHIRIKYPQLTS